MRKVLIITYYWPPAGGPGVQRWLKFVKYFQDFGIEPIVFIPKNAHYPIQDPSLEKEIPARIKVYELNISEPYKLASLFFSKKTKRISSGVIQTKNQSFLEKMMLWVRGNFYIPDARKNWVKPSISFLSEILEKEKIDSIITTGPPHSMHLIGNGLKKKFNVNWLADFRDPWTSIGYHKKLKLTKSSQRKHKSLENQILNNADQIVVTSKTTKSEFQKITERPISVITNGYDSDYHGGSKLDENFTLTHIGSLLTGRNPENLWSVLSEIALENPIFQEKLRLEFFGVVSQEVIDSLHSYNLGSFINRNGYISHASAIKKQQSAQILLLVEIDSEDSKGIIPGKLFEYMAARRPILALGPENWDAGQLIKETHTGKVFNYKAYNELKDVILKWFEAFNEGGLMVSSRNTDKFSRRSLTEELSKLL